MKNYRLTWIYLLFLLIFPQAIFAQGVYRFEMETFPRDARIRILNIQEKFQQKMKLEKGKGYRFEVSAPGFRTKIFHLQFNEKTRHYLVHRIVLEKEEVRSNRQEITSNRQEIPSPRRRQESVPDVRPIDDFYQYIQSHYRLTLRMNPPDAKVRILNLKKPFQQRMELEKGRTYQVEISSPGFISKLININFGEPEKYHYTHEVSLQSGSSLTLPPLKEERELEKERENIEFIDEPVEEVIPLQETVSVETKDSEEKKEPLNVKRIIPEIKGLSTACEIEFSKAWAAKSSQQSDEDFEKVLGQRLSKMRILHLGNKKNQRCFDELWTREMEFSEKKRLEAQSVFEGLYNHVMNANFQLEGLRKDGERLLEEMSIKKTQIGNHVGTLELTETQIEEIETALQKKLLTSLQLQKAPLTMVYIGTVKYSNDVTAEEAKDYLFDYLKLKASHNVTRIFGQILEDLKIEDVISEKMAKRLYQNLVFTRSLMEESVSLSYGRNYSTLRLVTFFQVIPIQKRKILKIQPFRKGIQVDGKHTYPLDKLDFSIQSKYPKAIMNGAVNFRNLADASNLESKIQIWDQMRSHKSDFENHSIEIRQKQILISSYTEEKEKAIANLRKLEEQLFEIKKKMLAKEKELNQAIQGFIKQRNEPFHYHLLVQSQFDSPYLSVNEIQVETLKEIYQKAKNSFTLEEHFLNERIKHLFELEAVKKFIQKEQFEQGNLQRIKNPFRFQSKITQAKIIFYFARDIQEQGNPLRGVGIHFQGKLILSQSTVEDTEISVTPENSP